MRVRADEWLDRPAKGHDSVILVHDECADGYTSAGLLLRRLPTARVVYTRPHLVGDELARLAQDRDVGRVVLADLSPQQGALDAIESHVVAIQQRGHVAWLDHHDPQWPNEFEVRLREAGAHVEVDRTGTECGASLVAAWTRETDPQLKHVADRIRLRDAWVDPHDAEARAWTFVARTHGREYVDRLTRVDLGGYEAEGKRLVEREEAVIQGILARVQHHAPHVAWVWGEEDISDAADRLWAQDPAAAFLLRFTPKGRVSVRSRPEHPKAAELAQRMGGGGHANAAGFDLGLSWWKRFAYRRQKERHPLVRGVLDEAAAMRPAPTARRAPPARGATAKAKPPTRTKKKAAARRR